MKPRTPTVNAALVVIVFMAVTASVPAESPFAEDPRGLYTRKAPSSDGIGKVYMGREISFTLGHAGIRWLERPDRVEDERPDHLVELLDIDPHTVIADIGAGSGYFSFRLSAEVPRGRVLAVDIEPEMLREVERRVEQRGVTNVETLLGTPRDPRLPEGSLDAVLIVDAYHEFSHPREMMEGILRGLKPGGRVFLVEYRGEDAEVPMLPLHKMSLKQIRAEMAAVGLEFVENRDGLPWQHLVVLQKSEDHEQN